MQSQILQLRIKMLTDLALYGRIPGNRVPRGIQQWQRSNIIVAGLTCTD
jgi:hypothetical protein